MQTDTASVLHEAMGYIDNFALQLAAEWMSKSAGLAFAPHVIHIAVGEVCYVLAISEQLTVQIWFETIFWSSGPFYAYCVLLSISCTKWGPIFLYVHRKK